MTLLCQQSEVVRLLYCQKTPVWMAFDNIKLQEFDVPVTIAVQVNGKLRATIEVTSEKAKVESEVMKTVMENEHVKNWAPGEVKKAIFVPGKLVNLVV